MKDAKNGNLIAALLLLALIFLVAKNTGSPLSTAPCVLAVVCASTETYVTTSGGNMVTVAVTNPSYTLSSQPYPTAASLSTTNFPSVIGTTTQTRTFCYTNAAMNCPPFDTTATYTNPIQQLPLFSYSTTISWPPQSGSQSQIGQQIQNTLKSIINSFWCWLQNLLGNKSCCNC